MLVGLEIAGMLLALVPLYAVARAYRQSPSTALGLALIAFALLVVRMGAMVATHTFVRVDHSVEELIEFGGDLGVVFAFACAFLYGIRGFNARRYADVA